MKLKRKIILFIGIFFILYCYLIEFDFEEINLYSLFINLIYTFITYILFLYYNHKWILLKEKFFYNLISLIIWTCVFIFINFLLKYFNSEYYISEYFLALFPLLLFLKIEFQPRTDIGSN